MAKNIQLTQLYIYILKELIILKSIQESKENLAKQLRLRMKEHLLISIQVWINKHRIVWTIHYPLKKT